MTQAHRRVRARLTFVVASAAAVGAVQLGGMSAAQAATTVPSAPSATVGFNGVVHTVAYGNGVVYVGGDFTAAVQGSTSTPRSHVAAINEATGQLLPWNPGADGSVRSVVVDGGSVYLGGAFTHAGGATHRRLARVNASTGAVDNSWNPSVGGTVRSVAVTPSKVYAGGAFTTAGGQPRSYLAAFNTSGGALDPGWAPVANGFVWDVRAANGWVYAGGEFTSINNDVHGRFLAALDPNSGAIQPGYNSQVTYTVFDMVVTSSLIYAAADGAGGHLRALNLNGSSRWTLTADGGVQAVAVVGDAIYIGGHFDNICTTARNAAQGGACLDGQVSRTKFAAVDVNGTLQNWAPMGNSAHGAWALAGDPATGRLAAGGEFTTFNNGRIRQPYFAQFG
jgi:hypothetical protein